MYKCRDLCQCSEKSQGTTALCSYRDIKGNTNIQRKTQLVRLRSGGFTLTVSLQPKPQAKELREDFEETVILLPYLTLPFVYSQNLFWAYFCFHAAHLKALACLCALGDGNTVKHGFVLQSVLTQIYGGK